MYNRISYASILNDRYMLFSIMILSMGKLSQKTTNLSIEVEKSLKSAKNEPHESESGGSKSTGT